MPPLRIAVLAPPDDPVLERLLADPNRGVIWTLVRTPDEPADYVLAWNYDGALPEGYEGKILAVHDCGAEDAIFFGGQVTRSAIHILNDRGEPGPLFLLGPESPIAPMALDARERGDGEFLSRYAELHRRWMQASWSEMLSRALELLAGGLMKVVGDVVWIDGAPGPCRLGHTPDSCHEPEAFVARGIPRSCPFIG